MSCGGCLNTIANGVVGVAKAGLAMTTGIGGVPDDVLRSRRRECWNCPHSKPCAGMIGEHCQCELCGCAIVLKTAVASENCPAGKWAATTPNT